MDMYDEPTEKRIRGEQNVTSVAAPPISSGPQPGDVGASPYGDPTLQPGWSAAQATLADQPTVTQKNLARRRFMGKSLAGLLAAGGAAMVGGVALGEWMSHGGLNSLFHGPAASNVQTGHLLRRAGFGASASELNMYSSLGYQGAVDRLLNYQQVDDSAMEQRLQALNLNLNSPADQQRWWLLRMAWTQRPLLEKMTLFWSGVLTSSFRKVGGPRAYYRMIVQNNFLRAHAFDTFDNILLGITADPAMLFYLDLRRATTQAGSRPRRCKSRSV